MKSIQSLRRGWLNWSAPAVGVTRLALAPHQLFRLG